MYEAMVALHFDKFGAFSQATSSIILRDHCVARDTCQVGGHGANMSAHAHYTCHAPACNL